MNKKTLRLIDRKSQLQSLLKTNSDLPATQVNAIKQKIGKLEKLLTLSKDLQDQEKTLKIQYLTLIKERNVYFDKLRKIEILGEENEWKGHCLKEVYNYLIDLRQQNE